MHQGDLDGVKGLYHINAVDEVTQWQVVGATAQISEGWLLPVLEVSSLWPMFVSVASWQVTDPDHAAPGRSAASIDQLIQVANRVWTRQANIIAEVTGATAGRLLTPNDVKQVLWTGGTLALDLACSPDGGFHVVQIGQRTGSLVRVGAAGQHSAGWPVHCCTRRAGVAQQGYPKR